MYRAEFIIYVATGVALLFYQAPAYKRFRTRALLLIAISGALTLLVTIFDETIGRQGPPDPKDMFAYFFAESLSGLLLSSSAQSARSCSFATTHALRQLSPSNPLHRHPMNKAATPNQALQRTGLCLSLSLGPLGDQRALSMNWEQIAELCQTELQQVRSEVPDIIAFFSQPDQVAMAFLTHERETNDAVEAAVRQFATDRTWLPMSPRPNQTLQRTARGWSVTSRASPDICRASRSSGARHLDDAYRRPRRRAFQY